MMDIFSSFDPAINVFFSFSSLLFWLFNFLLVFILHPVFWVGVGRSFWRMSFPVGLMYEQSARTFRVNLKGFSSLLVSLFVLIIFVNFGGILPYVFSVSSHLLFTLILGLPMWVGLILSGLVYSVSVVAASLLPSGAPS